MMSGVKADVCLILEGSYPYVEGGVSTWTHELLQRQSHLTFHILTITPRDSDLVMKYNFPSNVVGHTNVRLQRLPAGEKHSRQYREDICPRLKEPLLALTSENGNIDDFRKLVKLIEEGKGNFGSALLMDSEDTWNLLVSMYEEVFSDSSFLDYFWSWRALMGSLYSLLLAPLPQAKMYHCLSTGYAGLMAARAKIETNAPVVVTEHGIYTNERRIEIASANWLDETSSRALTIDRIRRDLRDFWIDSFGAYSRICYESSDRIITLYEGNQTIQKMDGARPDKMRIIPNGIDFEHFSSIQRKKQDHPVVALIGRVVPIKDIKSFIRSIYILHKNLPELKSYVLGPTDEDQDYYEECKAMVEHLGLVGAITFTGKVKIEDYLKEIDVIALTSISEAQPLALLEGGACGIPAVATDVGACSEIILGKNTDRNNSGPGGMIVPLSNPTAVAEALFELLTNQESYNACSAAICERVKKNYNKNDQHASYKGLYGELLESA